MLRFRKMAVMAAMTVLVLLKIYMRISETVVFVREVANHKVIPYLNASKSA